MLLPERRITSLRFQPSPRTGHSSHPSSGCDRLRRGAWRLCWERQMGLKHFSNNCVMCVCVCVMCIHLYNLKFSDFKLGQENVNGLCSVFIWCWNTRCSVVQIYINKYKHYLTYWYIFLDAFSLPATLSLLSLSPARLSSSGSFLPMLLASP